MMFLVQVGYRFHCSLRIKISLFLFPCPGFHNWSFHRLPPSDQNSEQYSTVNYHRKFNRNPI